MSEKHINSSNDEYKLKETFSPNEEEIISTSKSDIEVSSPTVSTSVQASTVDISTSTTSVAAPIIVITSVSDISVSTPAALHSTTAVSISAPVDSTVTLSANEDESSSTSTSGVDVSSSAVCTSSAVSTPAALPSAVSISTPVDSAVTLTVDEDTSTSESDGGVTSAAVSTSTVAVSTSTTSAPSSTKAVFTSISAVSTPVALPSSDAGSVLIPVVPALASSIATSMADFAESYPIIHELLQNSLALSNPLVSNMLQSEDSWVDRLKNWNREYQKLEKLNMVRCLEGKKQDSEIELKEPGVSRPDEDGNLAINPLDSAIKDSASKDLDSETLASEPCQVVAVSSVPTNNLSANNDSAQSDSASTVEVNSNEEGGPRNTPESEVVLLLIPQFRYLLSTLSELEEFIDDQVRTGTAADAVARASSPFCTTTEKSGPGVESAQSSAPTDSVKNVVLESVAHPERKESEGRNEAIVGASSPFSTTDKSVPGVESALSSASADSVKDTVPELVSVAQPERKESEGQKESTADAEDNLDAAAPASSETTGESSEQKQEKGVGNPPEVLSILRRLDEEVQNRVIECSERAESIVSVCHEHGAERFREEIVSHMMGIMEGLNFHVRVRMELGRLLKLHLNIEETAGLTFIMKVNTQISEAYNRLLDDILTLNIIVLENIRSVPV